LGRELAVAGAKVEDDVVRGEIGEVEQPRNAAGMAKEFWKCQGVDTTRSARN
jgi:hypothetical protein